MTLSNIHFLSQKQTQSLLKPIILIETNNRILVSLSIIAIGFSNFDYDIYNMDYYSPSDDDEVYSFHLVDYFKNTSI